MYFRTNLFDGLSRGLKKAAGSICLFILVAMPFPETSSGAEKDSGEHLPMYGQPEFVRPDHLKKADDAFTRDSIARYGSRQAAGDAFASEGWQALKNNQRDVALERFNRSWLLDPKNYQAFWGFAAILSEQGKLAAAIEQLETARELNDEPSQRVALLSDLGSLYSEYAARMPAEQQLDRARHFVLANNRFVESVEIAPEFAPAWRAWAISLYQQERYSEAWVKAQRALELKGEPFPGDFLEKLAKKRGGGDK
jgi:tetratricopeptide (TPR) repeat protein